MSKYSPNPIKIGPKIAAITIPNVCISSSPFVGVLRTMRIMTSTAAMPSREYGHQLLPVTTSTALASPSTTIHTGTATGIAMELTCLTAGRFEWPDGAASTCSARGRGKPHRGLVRIHH